MLPPDTLPAHSGDAVARLEKLLLEGLASWRIQGRWDKTFWADLRAEAERLVAERGPNGKKK